MGLDFWEEQVNQLESICRALRGKIKFERDQSGKPDSKHPVNDEQARNMIDNLRTVIGAYLFDSITSQERDRLLLREREKFRLLMNMARTGAEQGVIEEEAKRLGIPPYFVQL